MDTQLIQTLLKIGPEVCQFEIITLGVALAILLLCFSILKSSAAATNNSDKKA